MSTLVQNVAKVKSAYDALSASIEAKGVSVPAGTKLTGMPALVDQIQTGGSVEPTNDRAVFAYDYATSLVIPKMLVVDTISMTNLIYCFVNCTSLTSLTFPAGFGQNAINLYSCFNNCKSLTSLTFPAGFGQNAESLYNCFANCTSLTSLTFPAGFGQNAINLYGCFYKCTSLTSLTLPDGFGQNVINLGSCFNNCTSLTSLTLPAGFGQNATTLYGCFDACGMLTNIIGNPNFKVSLDLSPCPNLTHDSIMVVINGLQTVTKTQTLTLGSTSLAKLTDEEKQIATDKGWTLA